MHDKDRLNESQIRAKPPILATEPKPVPVPPPNPPDKQDDKDEGSTKTQTP